MKTKYIHITDIHELDGMSVGQIRKLIDGFSDNTTLQVSPDKRQFTNWGPVPKWYEFTRKRKVEKVETTIAWFLVLTEDT